MNVVIAALSAPEHLNGVSRHCANLVRGLLTRPEISQLHILAGVWQQGAFGDAIGRQDARLHVHPVRIRNNTVSRNLWYISELPSVAMQLGADVVHLGYPMPVSGQRFGCASVVSLHDLYPFDIPQNFGLVKSALHRQVVRQCLDAVDAIACVSESTRERLTHWLGSSIARKAITVPNLVEPAATYCCRATQSWHRGQPFVLCVAQHRRNKNIPLAIRVFERALRTSVIDSDSLLVVIGVPGPETRRIRSEIAELRLGRRVVLLSGMKDEELHWCYRNCEVLLAPSSIEGFGLPIVEGLLAGCHVVCSDIPAFREIGGDACRYVSLGPDRIEGFVQAIEAIRNAPSRLPQVIPEFSAAAIAKRYVALYCELQNRASVASASKAKYRKGGVELGA